MRGGAILAPERRSGSGRSTSELAGLGIKFGDNLLKETNGYRLVVEKKEDLAGLPERVVAGARRGGEGGGARGQVGLHAAGARASGRSCSSPRTASCGSRSSPPTSTRCDHGDETDNKAMLARIAALRAERAKLLGFAT